jgi:oxygen-dependent protoporphyrinogen oxidase
VNDVLSSAVLDVAVVGGGISGLAAAYELQRRGLSVRVFEAGSRAGGVITTERFDEWVIDGGPDSMLVQKPAAVALCRELGIADRLISTLTPRAAYILRDDRLHRIAEGSFLGFPLDAASLARSSVFTIGGRLRMACEAVVPRRSGDEDESIGTFVRRRFGQEAVDYLAEPLLAGIHAGDVDRLSAQALFPRLLAAERQSGSVMRAFRAMRARPSPQGAFVSLPGGIAELVDALLEALAPGTVRLSTRVSEIHRHANYHIETSTGSAQARTVILAVPAYVAASLLRVFDTTIAALAEATPYASTATVALAYRRDQVGRAMQGTGFVVPRVERSPLLAATWVTSKWPHRAPEGHVLLRGFLGGGRDPRRLDADDEELVALVVEELTRLMDIAGEPLFTRLFRWTKQSPQYEVGHLQRVATIDDQLASIPGMFLTGSGFRAIGIPDCIADARETAARAAGFVGSNAI